MHGGDLYDNDSILVIFFVLRESSEGSVAPRLHFAAL